jgi:hypothetical protein
VRSYCKSGSPDGLNKKCSGGDLSVYGRLRLRWMLSLQFMQNIAASLSCIEALYYMFLELASKFIRQAEENILFKH